MRNAEPKTIYLKDYQAPAFAVLSTALEFELGEQYTIVSSRLELQRSQGAGENAPLLLNGVDLELLSLSIDGRELTPDDYSYGDEKLTIASVPARCVLQCRTKIEPQNNSSLEGLYRSRDLFCTQCEAEGFRKITFFPDRPDVMSVYTVTIEAEQQRFPVLLSNGNLVDTQLLSGGRHRVTWHDPFPKPSYLFALVAGNLVSVDDQFVTKSGRIVDLHIYVEEKDSGKCAHAMTSLKKSMAWDEQVFGREYDLDVFNIVAVDDFNMGAMENKSLNIFNSSCVLATPEITTDIGFQRIEAIVAHEYFHNWSGNRVTCRDWFQLSLKEGFTVFRDALFSADMASATVKRVEDASLLRTAQFAEDAGPMAHSVRPDSFIEISNFYTVTVYEKGAEVVRMIYTLLGAEKFRAGSDLYFERHDGQAVTCEDFVTAMEDASDIDLGQFRRWYSQAGTPQLEVSGHYDAEKQQYTLDVQQSCPPTPGQSEKQLFSIPLSIGLLGDAGNLPLTLAGEQADCEQSDNTSRVLMVDKSTQRFVFSQVPEPPIPSLLRGFSAPVRLHYPYSSADLCQLMSRDGDGFVRWDAAQLLGVRTVQEVQLQLLHDGPISVNPLLGQACAGVLADESLDPAMVAMMLLPPSENYLAELSIEPNSVEVHSLHKARMLVQQAVADVDASLLQHRYKSLQSRQAYEPSAQQMGERALKNACLELLVSAHPDNVPLAQAQFNGAANMTDQLAALRCLVHYGGDDCAEQALADFYQQWRHETLVINQWLQIQASNPRPSAVTRVKALMQHADFDLCNPNRVRALIGAFSSNNPVNFHQSDGAGYHLLAEVIVALNSINPQIAARLLTPLTRWRKYTGTGSLMQAELQRLADRPDLSRDVYEVVSKSLG